MRVGFQRVVCRGAGWFFAGVLLGLLLCSLLGRLWSHQNTLSDYARLSDGVSPAVNYLPSADQLLNLIHGRARPDQVLVLIGGSSVLYGTGQGTSDLWSTRLQSLLGDHYAVLNLAQPSGWFTGYATTMLAVVAAEYPKYILIDDGQPPADPEGAVTEHKYLFWDAYYKGMLSPAILPHPQELLSEIERRTATLPLTQREKVENTRLGMKFDGLFYFNECWGWIRFNQFNFIYNHPVRKQVWAPLKRLPDESQTPARPREEVFPVPGSPLFATYMNLLKGYCRPLDGTTSRVLDQTLKTFAFASIAPRTILVQIAHARYFLNYLSDEERASYFQNKELYRQVYLQHGYTVRSFMDMDESDNYDIVHLNPNGGNKMAEALAEDVRELVKKDYGN